MEIASPIFGPIAGQYLANKNNPALVYCHLTGFGDNGLDGASTSARPWHEVQSFARADWRQTGLKI